MSVGSKAAKGCHGSPGERSRDTQRDRSARKRSTPASRDPGDWPMEAQGRHRTAEPQPLDRDLGQRRAGAHLGWGSGAWRHRGARAPGFLLDSQERCGQGYLEELRQALDACVRSRHCTAPRDDHAIAIVRGHAYLRWKGTADTLAAMMDDIPPDWDPDGAATYSLYTVFSVQRRYADGLAIWIDPEGSSAATCTYISRYP